MTRGADAPGVTDVPTAAVVRLTKVASGTITARWVGLGGLTTGQLSPRVADKLG